MAASTPELPADRPNQTYVTVKAIVAGHVWLRDSLTFDDARDSLEDQGSLVPAFSFLISHPAKGQALFDLGVRKHGEGYPPALVDRIKTFKVQCDKDAADLLVEGGVDPGQIDTIIYSHMHFDHIGDPERIPSAKIILGGDAKVLLEDAYPPNTCSRFLALPAGREVVYIDFSSPAQPDALVKPFGAFETAYDLYGDGSLYLVDAPGHVQGHMVAAARVGPDAFVLLCGDTCHNRQCYVHGRTIARTMYVDWPLAQETAARLGRVHKELKNVVVILAHEHEREQEMPLFPLALNEWAVGEIEKRKLERI